MGGTSSILTIIEHDRNTGRLFIPDKRLVPFPVQRHGPPGQLVTFFSALPPGYRLPKEPDSLFWWVDCKFIPCSDNVLVVTVGAYEGRPGRTPLVITPQVKGLIYTITFMDRLKFDILKGSRTSAMPAVQTHPNGNAIGYVGEGKIIMMELASRSHKTKEKDMRNNNFKQCCISPDGTYMASVARLHCGYYELCVMIVESAITFLTIGTLMCHDVCPGFIGNRLFTEQVECKFSPDSSFVAVSSSLGMLFVAQICESTLKPFCGVLPGIFDTNCVKLSNARCFDFDPRCLHHLLATGTCSDKNKIHVIDINNKGVVGETEIDSDCSLDCLKYGPEGRVLAVATGKAQVLLLNPDSMEFTYRLDGTLQGPHASMKANSNGFYPSILHLAFTQAGNHLAVTSTDGIVRVWQLQPHLCLQHLARNSILQNVPANKLHKLGLPSKLVRYLLQWPSG